MDRSRGAGTAVGSRGFCRLSFYRLSFYRLSFCLACVCSAAFAGPDPDTVRVAFVEASAVGPAHVRVLGLSPRELIRMREPSALDGVLSIHVVTNGVTNETPVFGRPVVLADRLVFMPRYALVPGLTYQARFTRGPDGQVVEARHRLAPLPPRPPGRVLALYPGAAVLPENTLRFYLHFSLPMRRGQAYEHIRLEDGAGEQVAFPFLELAEELWGPEGKRLTLLFDPGRIKRGLKPRNEVGPPLEVGRSYTLTIDRAWEDDRGQRLAESHQKRFVVEAPDVVQPDPTSWHWRTPAAGTLEPLILTLPEPLDRAMLLRVLVPLDGAGGAVRGAVTVSEYETVWGFTPARPWRAGSFALSVRTTLEDRAGNSIARPFEVDLTATSRKPPAPDHIQLPFVVR